MPRALITGIAGFVGSHLAEYLLENTDWDVYGLLRWDESLDNLVNVRDKVTLVEGDLTDSGSIREAVAQVGPDYVFHLAAQSYVQASFRYPSKTLEVNVIGTTHLMEALRAVAPDALIHNCSSSEVYGRVPAGYGPIDEACPLAPASPYSVSKIGQDFIGRFYHQAYGLKVLTTRMFTHTGPRRGDVFAESSFAKQVAMIEAGLQAPPIRVGNLNSTRTIQDVRDAVRAYYLLLTKDPAPGEVYNIGGSHTCTIGDVLNALNVNGYQVEQAPSRMRPLDADFQIPDCRKFVQHTGWQPEIPFQQTMDDLLEYWRGRVRCSVVVNR